MRLFSIFAIQLTKHEFIGKNKDKCWTTSLSNLISLITLTIDKVVTSQA